MSVRIYDLPATDWPPLRPEATSGVNGWSLLPAGWRAEKIVIARMAPGGSFAPHRDPYHHVFWFLAGEGEITLEGKSCSIQPGRVVEVPAGSEHAYRNTGGVDLVLLTVNAREVEGGRAES